MNTYCKIQTYNFTIFSSISSFHSQILKSALKNRWQHPYTAGHDHSECQLVVSNHPPKGRHLDTHTIIKNKEFKKDSLQDSATHEVAFTYSGGGGLNQSLQNEKRLRIYMSTHKLQVPSPWFLSQPPSRVQNH